MMRAISSHRDIKMRVLILSAALFACATGAPSGAVLAPVVPAVVPAVPLPAATVNSGDLQAAFIDAKVQTEDFLRAAADKTRESTEQVIEDTKEKVIEINDLAKERSLEAFWATEERKWQALDAIKTAEARLDGQVASQADATAKSLVIPTGVAPIVPVVAPIAYNTPFYYQPGIISPGFKAYSTDSLIQIQPEAPKAEEKKEEPKSDEKPEENKNDSVKIETADVKSAEPKPEPASNDADGKYVVANTHLIPQFPLDGLKLASQWVPGPVVYVQPGFKTALPYSAQVLTPTVIKTVW